MILLLDNYDSFTYNIKQTLESITDEEVRVIRSDVKTAEEILALKPDRLIISPGPGYPGEAGISEELIRRLGGKIPILGVCLGHQAIASAFGARIIPSRHLLHGKEDRIRHDGRGVFRYLPKDLGVIRYHSLAVDPETLPDDFEISARSVDGEIMGIRHKKFILEGVQFHPESIGMEGSGKALFENFLHYKRKEIPVNRLLEKITEGESLSREEIGGFMEAFSEGKLSDALIAGFLTALNTKGISVDEVVGSAAVLKAKKFKADAPEIAALDTCGTGGDGQGSFNVSSLTALVAASCGVPVAKHGNKAVSSLSGSSEYYEALGIPVKISPEEAVKLLKEEGFSFFFAPYYHSCMKYAAPARKALGVKTIFNLLGPLVNPVETPFQLIGVFHEKYASLLARAGKALGIRRIMTVYSEDGLDEFSVSAPTRIFFIDENNREEERVFHPREAGIELYEEGALKGGTPEENVRETEALLEGKGRPALRDAVALNAGAALYVYGKVKSIPEGYRRALESFEKGEAARLIKRLRARKTGQKAAPKL